MNLHRAEFEASFNLKPFRINHALADHPLFELPRLVELAQRLESSAEGGGTLAFAGNHAINQVDEAIPAGKQPRTFIERKLCGPELSVSQIVEQIENCNAWLQLRNISVDPEYRKLVSDLIHEFRPHVRGLSPTISGVRGDIFVSSPNATTPFHMDEEHNFLFQMRGEKTIAIADGSNREVVSEEQLESFFKGESELAKYSPHLDRYSVRHELRAGDAVHIPPCHPHWVKNGDAVSVSFGVLWHSDVTVDQRRLHLLNSGIRSAGLNPRPVGQSDERDRLKLAPFRIRRCLLRAMRKRKDSSEFGFE